MGDLEPSDQPERAYPEPGMPASLPIPTTFGGVAALALGPFRWLVGWQVVVALGAALITGWALEASLGRDLRKAAEALPDTGSIRNGRLDWTGRQALVLFQGPFLGVVVDPGALRQSGLTSDFTLSIESDRVAVGSLFGWAQFPYPPDLRVGLGRPEMSGALAAWMQPAVQVAAVTVFFGLLATWAALGGIYGTVLWILASAFGRSPRMGVSWRLAAASLLLPAVLMTAAIGLYATRDLGLVGLLAAVPVHIAAGWVYCLGGLAHIPRRRGNPFEPPPPPPPPPTPEPESTENLPRSAAAPPAQPRNPFQAPS